MRRLSRFKWWQLTVDLWDDEADTFEKVNTVHGEGRGSAVQAVHAPGNSCGEKLYQIVFML